MAKRVNLDAMIPREDFALLEPPVAIEQHPSFNLRMLSGDDPFLALLRKPDFQRETNHWSPQQIATFLYSYVEGEVIPSLILWFSKTRIFVIDGGHRLSALRAWMENDYGDGVISAGFYAGVSLPKEQMDIADKTRKLVEKSVGRFATLKSYVGSSDNQLVAKANRVFQRNLHLQWVNGEPNKAETSFFKINTQGTPLDPVEQKLIRYRRTPIAISARAILRAGSGHKYWSMFSELVQDKIRADAKKIHDLILQPQVDSPVTTLDLPLAGTISPVEALDVLIQVIEIAGNRKQVQPPISEYVDDSTGDATLAVLGNTLDVLGRFTSNESASLGFHPAVYFYSSQGIHNSYLFLGMLRLVTEQVINNNGFWFKRFTKARKSIEDFLLENKDTLLLLMSNMSKGQRIKFSHDLISHLEATSHDGRMATLEEAISALGLQGKIVDIKHKQTTPEISDAAKSIMWITKLLAGAPHCPLCHGLLDSKSHSYDHVQKVGDGGTGHTLNLNLTHPYCNSIRDWIEKEMVQ